LTNSGMSALAVVNEALRGKCKHIVVGKGIYSETPNLFATNGATIHYVDYFLTDSFFHELRRIKRRYGIDAIIIEPVGNSPKMPACSIAKLLDFCWDQSLTLVVDNTLMSAELYNPFISYRHEIKSLLSGSPVCQFVYIESLSKFYKAGDLDDVTAGIIVASEKFIDRCDGFLKWGHYLPYHSLAKMPFELFEAVSKKVLQIHAITKKVSDYLHHVYFQKFEDHGRDIIGNIFCRYTVRKPHFVSPGGGPVIFFEIKKTQGLLGRLKKGFGPIKGSFGHPETTYLPLGAFMEDMPDGLVRLAIGYNETPEQIIEKLKVVLEVK